VPTARTCLVSFTDSNGIRHAVEVAGDYVLRSGDAGCRRVPALRMDGRSGTGDETVGERAGARNITRGPVEQDRGVAAECREAE